MWTSKAGHARHAQAAKSCVACKHSVDYLSCVQSFYEEQKREQMQGPALKRLEEEQQQQAQAPPLADDQWQDSQYTIGQDQQDPAHQPDLPFDESQLPFDQTNLPFDEANGLDDSQQESLQLNGPRSWAGRRQSHQPQPHMPIRPASSQGLPFGMAGSFSGVSSSGARGAKAHASPKPPLPGRRQRTQSSEMAYLGGSAGASAGSGSDSDHM